MKTVIAYIILIIGIPNIVGILLGALVTLPISFLLSLSGKFRLTVLPYLEVFSGFGAIITAMFLFHIFGLIPSVVVPIVVAVWISCYFKFYKQSPIAWCSWMVGIIIGWLTIRQFFS